MSIEKLAAELESAQRTVVTDQYPMSIGELVSMYRDGELILNPKFQRFYRWSGSQKSALIESILVGIPIPPIFCFEREDSKWEIVDGLQRVSTILEFMGYLKDAGGALRPQISLSATQYLPSLEGANWEAAADGAGMFALSNAIQIAFKRAKIGIQIIKKSSAGSTKFDLFQRLNSNGSPLTPQEYRSCILVMIDEKLFDDVVGFANEQNFRNILRLDADDTDRQDDIDYACRYLTHLNFEYLSRDKDIDEFISDSVKVLFLSDQAGVAKAVSVGTEVACKLAELFGPDALRRLQGGKPVGRMGRVGFETIVVGVAHNWAGIKGLANPDDWLIERVNEMWAQPQMAEFSSPGTRGTDRIRKTVPFGKAWFQP